MVKVYYTYSLQQVIGQALSRSCNFAHSPTRTFPLNQDKLLITGVNQYLAIISQKTGQVQKYLWKQGKNVPVRVVHLQGDKIYAGYQDGEIIVWGLITHELLFSFDMHKSTVSSITICEQQSKMISAGFDGNIMIWDLLSEQCETIKSAHPSMITAISWTSVLVKGKPTNLIISVGKDGFLRLWDMKTRVCLSAVSCQVTEIYSMFVDYHTNTIYVGTNKQQIVILGFKENQQIIQKNTINLCYIKGVCKKRSMGRANQLVVDQQFMYVFNSDNTIQVWKMLKGKQMEMRKKRLANRKKKGENTQEKQINQNQQNKIDAEMKFIQQKVVPFKFYNGLVIDSRILINNGSNIFQLGSDHQITHATGRTEQLCLQYPFIAQRTPNSICIYTSTNVNKLFTIQNKATCCHLFSNGFILIVGTQKIQIWDLLKNQMVYEMQQKWVGGWAKKNKCLLWRENELGFYQIGYDKNKNIKMKCVNVKRFQDKITQAVYKHDMQKYIVNLQNSQIHINYSDSHKSFLKLYGHKMPILSFSLSSDDSLLATGSLDKDIRLWDMDYGQSIKSIFAHQQPVTCVVFVQETHYLFSGSKDGHIKFWDMDTYQLIMDFQQNTMQVRSIAVSNSGDFMVAGGLDEGLRVWKQTKQQTIASDMEQKQMEKIMIEDYAKQKLQGKQQKTKYQDLKHGEQIIQALQNKQTPKFIITLIKAIPPANLKSCLSFLHERHVRRLQQYIKIMIQGIFQLETCWRVLRELDRPSGLGVEMRNIWKPVEKMVKTNTEILRMLLNQIKQENQMII